MNYGTALTALKMNVFCAMIFFFRGLIHKTVCNRGLVLYKLSTFSHFIQIAVHGRLVYIKAVLLQVFGQFSRSKAAVSVL